MLFWNKKKVIGEVRDEVYENIDTYWCKQYTETKNINEFLTKQYEELCKQYGMREKFKEVNDRIDKKFERLKELERIVKYARDDKPTFNLIKRSQDTRVHDKSYTYYLHIYVNKEEYIIELSDLFERNILEDCCSLEIKDKIAHFIVNVSNEDDWKQYKFIIDYKNNKYVLNEKIDMCPSC